MNTLLGLLAAAVLLLAAPSFATEPEKPPPVFAHKTVAQGREATLGNDKILVVKATASWCGPCKQMDRTTWRDEKVVKWVEANGLAVVFDVDEQKALAKELAIEAMPTMIAFKNGKEFDRIVGYKSADDLIAWMEAVKRGERSIDAAAKKLADQKAGGKKMPIQERLSLARELAQAGERDKATEEYVWLWKNMLAQEPSMVGVRGSFMVGDMQRLAQKHKPAKEAFGALRDETEARLKGEEKSWDDLGDWIALNEVVGEEDKTLAWFDRIKGEPDSERTIDRYAYRLERLLEQNNRWADMGRLVKNPEKKLAAAHTQMKRMVDMPMPPQMQEREEEIKEMQRDRFRSQAGTLYASLLAAGRDAEAQQVAEKSQEFDDSAAMRLRLVSRALDAGQPRLVQNKLLDAAEQADPDGDHAEAKRLRETLRRSLESRG